MSDFPRQICFDCGKKHGRTPEKAVVCSVWKGPCDICGAETSVTATCDFGFLKPGWDQ